jgi:LysM repeat protein
MDINIIKTLRIAAVIVALLSAGIGTVEAQEYVSTPVSISKDKVRINGRICYSHVVLEKQTLFSISKAYNVSVDEIYKFNPSLKESGLVKNSIIIIPVAEESEIQEPQPVQEQVEAPAQETKQEQDAANVQKEDGRKKKRKTHTVKWYENINDIAAKYGITPEEIIAANNLNGPKLKSRMKLVIPEPGEVAVIETEETGTQPDTSVVINNVNNQIEERDNEPSPWWATNKNEKVTTTLLLPFKATGTSGSRSNMDFYSGVLLAVNDLAAAGISTDLNVYDIADGNYETAGNVIRNSNLIIGPVSQKDITAALPYLSHSSVLVSPLDPKAESLVSTNSCIIQAPTPHKLQYDDLAAWMKEDCRPEDRVILISEKGARLTEASLEMKQSVDSAGLKYSTFSYSILEGRDIEKPLKSLMTAEASNRIMIISESEAFVNDVVRNLNMMIHQKYDVVLYGPSKIRSYETIEVENFHKTNLHVSLTYYIDYTDQRVKNLLLKYRALFNTEPTQFAFQGYDIASYFIELCSKYGKDWTEQMSHEEKSMLQSTFRCMKQGDGGYVNHGVRRIVYEKDWTISKVR